jgi:hypothetical protein
MIFKCHKYSDKYLLMSEVMKAIQAVVLYFDGYVIEYQYYLIFRRLNVNVRFGSCQYPSPGIISLIHGST